MSAIEIRVLENLEPDSALGIQWESLVRGNCASGFMQSLYWAEVKRRQGLTTFHLGLFENNQLTAGVIFYCSMRRNGTGILVAPEGPVLPWESETRTTEMLRLVMDAIQSYSQELGVMAIRIEPRLQPPVPSLLREFGRAPADLVPSETLYIDISASPESVLESMRPKGRYNIALSARNGLNVIEDSSGAAVEEFHKIVNEASQRDDFALEPLSFFEHIASVMGTAGHARLLFSKHEDETLGALLLINYGSRATYLYGGISNNKRNLMSGYALQWAAMNKAKEVGCTTYDFYGIDSFRSPEHRYARFSQFKSQFGGQVIRFIGGQDYFFLDNLADAFIKVVSETKVATEKESNPTGVLSDYEPVKQACLL